MNSKQIGILGEKIASKYLQNKGYQILDKNYSSKFVSGPNTGEIDIVAKKKDVISFVEVKTLSQINRALPPVYQGDPASLIEPEEKVNFQKQRKIIKTAESWLMAKKIPLDAKWQIDVISIKIDLADKKAKIRHFKNTAC